VSENENLMENAIKNDDELFQGCWKCAFQRQEWNQDEAAAIKRQTHYRNGRKVILQSRWIEF
jgi:hypothetical protein